MSSLKGYKHLESLRREQSGSTNKYFDMMHKVRPPRTAAQLEALIEELVNRSGGKVSIISSAGRQMVTKTAVKDILGRSNTITDNKYIPSTTIKGTPDILGCLPDGTGLAVEVKFSKSDRMSKDQLAYKDAWPGVFVIAKTLDDVLKVLE